MQYLRMKRWSPYVVGALIGVLSWFAFFSVDRPIGVPTAIAKSAGMIEGAVAPDKLGSVPGPCDLTSREIGKCDTTAELGAPAVPCEHDPGFRIDRRRDEWGGGRTGSAQHPFHVCGD